MPKTILMTIRSLYQESFHESSQRVYRAIPHLAYPGNSLAFATGRLLILAAKGSQCTWSNTFLTPCASYSKRVQVSLLVQCVHMRDRIGILAAAHMALSGSQPVLGLGHPVKSSSQIMKVCPLSHAVSVAACISTPKKCVVAAHSDRFSRDMFPEFMQGLAR